MVKGNKNKLITWLLKQEEEKIFEINEYKLKRSLDQNGYYYKLVNEMANVLRKSKEEVHFEMLKAYSQRQIISVAEEIDIQGFIPYFEEIGKGEVNGKVFKHYAVYKRSSELDTREMSILLDGTIQEAKQLDIETMTPQELAILKSNSK